MTVGSAVEVAGALGAPFKCITIIEPLVVLFTVALIILSLSDWKASSEITSQPIACKPASLTICKSCFS